MRTEVIQVTDARDSRRIGPDNLGEIQAIHEGRLRFGSLPLLLFFRTVSGRGKKKDDQADQQGYDPRPVLDRISVSPKHLYLPFLTDEALVACIAKCRVIRLVLHQQIRLSRRVWLMTRGAVNSDANFGVVGGIHLIDHRMMIHRMTQAILDR